MRVPLIYGFPLSTWGFSEIRGCQFTSRFYPLDPRFGWHVRVEERLLSHGSSGAPEEEPHPVRGLA
jgi:hypothetical protein